MRHSRHCGTGDLRRFCPLSCSSTHSLAHLFTPPIWQQLQPYRPPSMSSWSPPPARSTRLYIGGVTHATRTHDLEELFSRYGPLREVTIKEGFGFIEFVDPRDADAAERKYGGSRGVTTAGGDRLRVEFAKDRHSERRPRERMIEHRVMQRCYQCGKEGHMYAPCTHNTPAARSRHRALPLSTTVDRPTL